jgi:hypothetical protein
MAVNLESILGSRNLIGMIQSVMGRCPEDLLPPEMYKTSRSVEGNRGTYFKVKGTRQTARIAQYGGPSRARELPGVSEEPVTLIHAFEHCVHAAALLQNLVAEKQDSPDAEIKQRLGLQTITRQIQVFGDLFTNLRISAIYSALALGKIYWDATGNLLPTSSGAIYTVDYEIPTDTSTYPETPYPNVGTFAAVFQNAAAGLNVGWNTNDGTTGKGTADIQGQIIQLKNLARQRTGYPITHAYYGKSVLGYINNNRITQQVLTGSARYAEAAMMTEIPDGTFGIKKWYPVAEAFFTKSATTQVLGSPEEANIAEWFPAAQITFTPDPSPEWWEVLEGTYPVPSAFNITKDMMGQLTSLKQVAGAFSYATLQDDPPSVKHLAGDTFLPIIKVPGAVYIINTIGP